MDAPVLSLESGVYSEQLDSLEVAISAEQGATIHYTLDGSRPTPTSTVYSGPLALRNGRDDGPDAISKIVTGDEGDAYDPWYAPAEPPRTIPVLRAMAYKSGEASEIVTASYIFGETSTRYGTTPIFSICAEWMDLFNTNDFLDPKGIYVNKYRLDKRKVANCYVEMFEQDARQVASWIELRIQGTSTSSRPKKSLRLTGYNGFDGKKQPFDYAFFPGKENTLYATIVLRLGGNDWGDSLVRDQVAQAIGKHTLVDVQYANACIVFLNGVYWGVHEIRERWEDGYFEYQHGGLIGEKGGEYSLLEFGSGPPAVDTGWEDDEQTAVNDFTDILTILLGWNNDVSSSSRYQEITSRVNPDSNLQHFGSSLFTGNLDWPQNNQRFWRTFNSGTGKGGDLLNDGRWNWTFHDMDFAFTLPFDYVPDYANGLFSAYDAYRSIYEDEGPYVGTFIPDSARIFTSLLSNDTFLHRYLNFVYLHLVTAWRSDITIGVLDDHAALIQEAGMDENGLRWRMPHNEADWLNEIEQIRKYLIARPAAFAWHTRDRFNYSTNNTLVLDRTAGGQIEMAGFTLHPDHLPGFDGFPFSLPMPSDIPVTLTAQPETGYVFDGWYETTNNLPAVPPAPIAFDCTANYFSGMTLPSSSAGAGWGSWVAYSDGARSGTFIGSSMMPIHGESTDGRSFALYANGGNLVYVQRNLAGGRTVQEGETLSLDVGFGMAGDTGAGVAFTGPDDARPVQLILEGGTPYGEAYTLMVEDASYRLGNFPHLPGAPIHLALTRAQGGNQYTLRLIRGGMTYATSFILTNTVTGVRLYKNSYGDEADGYNVYFNNLRLAADTFGATTAVLDGTASRRILFHETGADIWEWTPTAGYNCGVWQNDSPLSNIGRPCFGLWADGDSETTSKLERFFGVALTTNMILSMDFQNNAIVNAGASVGINFLLDNDTESFTLLAAAGETNYVLHANGIRQNTRIPIGRTGLHIEVWPLDETALNVMLNGDAYLVEAPPAIAGVQVYNNNAGPGTPCNLFFNNVVVSTVADDTTPLPTNTWAAIFGPETAAASANWIFSPIFAGNAGWWTESSFSIGNAFGLYANNDYTMSATRFFGFESGADACLIFNVQHGEITEDDGRFQWELLDEQSNVLLTYWAEEGNSFYSVQVAGEDVIPAQGFVTTNAQQFAVDFITATNISINGRPSLALTRPVAGLRFSNIHAGSGSTCNYLFNNIAILIPADTFSSSKAAIRSANGDEGTLLGTNTTLGILLPTNRSIVARFRTPYQQWAATNNITDLTATNPATGVAYAEEFLRKETGFDTLHKVTGPNYRRVVTDNTGIDTRIYITTNLTDSSAWVPATPDELEPVEGEPGTYRVTAPPGGLLAIKLELIPILP